jgi:aminomethyltransferase
MRNTKFHSAHIANKAKMVEFAGYNMPIQYSSIIAEHKAVRSSVGVFDVSHMGEVFIKGDNALDFVQKITINDASKLFPGRVQYSAMCYPDGGIVDDLLVYCISPQEFLLVINASNVEKDYAWMCENNTEGVEIINKSDDYSLLAIQGPFSQKVVEKLFDIKLNIEYYHFTSGTLDGIDYIISRTGYTGELGFELYFQGDEAAAMNLWTKLFEAGKEFNIAPIGLGARDTLRLEMGFCLYGNEIDKTTNPLEAGLSWITRLNKGIFIGKDALVKVKQSGFRKRLIPLVSDERIFPRHGYEITVDGKKVGTVTSGTVSPSIDKAIALAYVDETEYQKGSAFNFSIRGKEHSARIVTLPFINAK